MIQESNLNFTFTVCENIWVFILFGLYRNVYFLVKSDSFESNFDELFRGSELWNIPYLFGQLYSRIFVKNETF